MNKILRLLALPAIWIAVALPASAEETITIPVLCIHGDLETKEVDQSADGPLSGIMASEYPSEKVLRSIMDFVGLKRSIQVIPYKDYSNACAEIGDDQKRRIYVDENWINRISGNDYWIKFFLLSHELGHHLNAHALAYNESESWEKETDADWFAGRVYRLANGHERALKAFFQDCPFVKSKTHPPCFIRQATVEQAYTGMYDVAPPAIVVALIDSDRNSDPTPSVSSPIGRVVSGEALSNIKVTAVETVVDEISAETEYDVVIQAGHFGRTSGPIGAQGEYVTEQELAAFISSRVADELRERDLKVALVGARRNFVGRPKSKVFLSIHADAASEELRCKLGPSIGYNSDQRPDAANVLASAISIALDYKITEFLRDNFSPNLRRYYAFNWFNTEEFAGIIQVGELTCPEQEIRLINESETLAFSLATALEFVVSAGQKNTVQNDLKTKSVPPAIELLREVLRTCSVSRNIEIDADLRGSIETIFDGDLTEGKLSFVDSSTFLEAIPSHQRLEAYKIYVDCIGGVMAENQ